MTLYHFCAERYRKSILTRGICVGGICVPTKTGFELYNGFQWLTADPDPERQSWATRRLVKYSRTAFRLTVEIPESAADRVMDRTAVEARFPGAGLLFMNWPGSENWRVFRGHIPPEWIVCAVRTGR